MEKTIHLDKEIFEQVESGEKKFEVRLGNKNISSGDILTIIQRNEHGDPTENKILKRIGHIELTKNMKFFSDEDKSKYGFKIIQLEDVE